ncbi:imelysin family protein [Leptospira saintgironsiae]|uniref:Imelysin n=1 Tax=Leptospira saintgironsiae TaxID=2023183 RepID=A0A2M9Y9M4_9LEPT|nr:imelysin family protein [Leptospira saintgironsiae]PJZ48143.1 imelysin [Leptospira saintgironsiae]
MRNIHTKIFSILFSVTLFGSLISCGGPGSDNSAAAILGLDIPASATKPEFLNRYSALAFESYTQAELDASNLSAAVDTFESNSAPSETDLTNLKNLWVKARASYLITEPFRFSNGPIDTDTVLECESGSECESLLNAWPLDEDAVDTYISNGNNVTNFASIYAKIGDTSLGGEADPEADKIVLTGYHPIEYILWGKDTSNTGAGNRPASYFNGTGTDGHKHRQYLKTITNRLVVHLGLIKDQWDPANTGNYRETFLDSANVNTSIGNVFQGLGSFMAGEWGGDRLTGVIGETQEEEHSCFSDTTKADFYYDAQGVLNIWTGNYSIQKGVNVSTGPGLSAILSFKQQGGIQSEIESARNLFCINLSDTESADPNFTTSCPAGSLTHRFDQAISSGDSQHGLLVNVQRLIGSTLNRDLVSAAAALGFSVVP